MSLELLKKLFSGLLRNSTRSPLPSEQKEAPVANLHPPVQSLHVAEEPLSSQSKPSVTASRRTEDMSAEAQLAAFLDKYLYDRFPDAQRYSSIERITDKREQLNGTDVRFTMKSGKVFNVDEKAQLYYLNKNLPTFAFEVQFLRHGIPTIGWLCNDRLDTDYYLLIWPFANRDTPAGITWRDFTRTECLMIKKQDVLSLLKQNGLTVGRLLADADKFRMQGLTGKIRIEGVSGIYYYISSSRKYAEEPINIVISKPHLRHIATRHYVVTPEGIERY